MLDFPLRYGINSDVALNKTTDIDTTARVTQGS